ncbi:MAG: ABC transporter ATP-binding protein [Planctomycetota bacterium]
MARLFPFVWPQRHRLVVSAVLAAIAAVLSVVALMLVFPVVKLLLEGQGLHEYIAAEQKGAGWSIATQTIRLQSLDVELDHLRLDDPESKLKLFETNRARCVSALKEAARREWQNNWIASTLLPWVPRDRFSLLVAVMAALLAVTALKCWASYLVDVLVGSVVERTMQSLRERLLRRTLQLDQQTVALETTPQLMSRFTFELQQVSYGLVLFGSLIVLEPLKALFCIGCALGVNWRLTALSFVCVPVGLVLFKKFGRGLKRASGRQMESMSRVYRVLDETLKSFRSVLAFRNERLHRRRLSREHRDYFDKAMQIVRIDALTNPSIEFLATVAVCAASLPGAYLVLHHQTSIAGVRLAANQIEAAELALLYSLLAGILDPARKLAGVFSLVKKSAAACDRVFGWMDRPSLIASPADPAPLPRHSQSIEFDRVTFRYASLDENGTRPPALDDVSICIPFGAVVAVVGGNGSGKSTLVNLLPRFCDAQSGTVRIDGVDLREADLRELRAQIGVVTQETLLFDRTIADNIAYGRAGASRGEIEEAARRARVTDFARQMPDGLETGVGDRGQRLSGGQRQRVALARAMLREPTILILDEATSAVDVHSEQLIHETLREFANGRTTLIVTHAMTTTLVELVSHVLVMEQGRAIAFGRHADVLATCPAYQRLFGAQSHRRAA